MYPPKEPLTCYHCGNTGILKTIASFDVPEEIVEKDEWGRVTFFQVVATSRWYLFQCPVCLEPVLINHYLIPDMEGVVTNVYPCVNIDKENTPPKIFQAYEAAVKTRGIDNAICLLSLRRALEMVCKDKNAQGDNLEKKIDDLIEKKVLPEMMRDACWIVRQCGNEAAHADDVEFSKREADEAIEYVGSIITYLYSTPVKVADLRRRIEKRQARQKEQKQEQNNVDCEENNG